MIKDIDFKTIKFNKIPKSDLVLALDRLTRFKSPDYRYFRVFSEIVSKYLISPKISKHQMEETDFEVLKTIFEKIWNESVEALGRKQALYAKKNAIINQVLKNEINSVYNISEETQKLVAAELRLAEIVCTLYAKENLPVNLKRLLYVDENYSAEFCREKFSLRFPVEKVVLCEGITEEILLPAFAKLHCYDFDKYGVKLIGAGGKNQVAKLYMKLKEELKIPVFILLDADAEETSKLISPVLREIDRIYLIKHGEFEDVFSLNLIKRTINKSFKNICECSVSDFQKKEPMTKVLTEFFRLNELGDFQKAEFAKAVSENLKYKTDLTEELIEIIEDIKDLNLTK